VISDFHCFFNSTGMVLFLEEDHYVTPDFLWVMNLLETDMIHEECQGCNILAMGTYLKTWNLYSSSAKVYSKKIPFH